MDTASGVELATRWMNTERQLIIWRDGYDAMRELADRQARERAQALDDLEEQIRQDSIRAKRQRRDGLITGLALGVVIGLLANR